MARRSGALAALSLSAFVLFAPAVAHADDEVDAPTVRAEKLAADAELRVAGGQYEQAIELYVAAYKESPAAVLLFDMAWIYEHHLRQKQEANELYRRALDAGDLEPRLVKLAEERLRAANALPSPPEEHPLPLPPDKKREEGRGWSTLKIGGVATAGVGVLGIGTSLVLGALAKSKDDEADQFCNGDRCTDARALSLTDDATGLATGANVMFVTGAVLLAGGLVMWLVAK
jgi:tetratricopeptide (TPR) repeat protein